MSASFTDEDRLWFPELAHELVTEFVAKNGNWTRLTSIYGTQRWLSGNPDAPLEDRGTFWLGHHKTTVEYLPASVSNFFSHLTLTETLPRSVSSQLQRSADVLMMVDGLADAVGRLVRVVHVLSAPKDQDISHSSPDLPFSIFVSVPEPIERDATLRLAESIVHEAMHLHLSLLEMLRPMVTDVDAYGYSPWKDELRPVGGLVHGLYVFAVIHQVLGVLSSQSVGQGYCERRRACIEQEVRMLPERPRGLTEVGGALWRRSRETVLPKT